MAIYVKRLILKRYYRQANKMTQITCMKFQKILIAVDDRVYFIKAARADFALVQRLRAGLIFVIIKSNEVLNTDLGITPELNKSVLLKEAEMTIDQYIKICDGADEVFRFMPEGFPEKEIIKVAKESKADIIIMGTHGRAGLSRMISGSLTDYIVRHAETPVLVTPTGMK